MEYRCLGSLGDLIATTDETDQHRQDKGHQEAVEEMVEQSDRESDHHVGALPQPEIVVEEIEREECEED